MNDCFENLCWLTPFRSQFQPLFVLITHFTAWPNIFHLLHDLCIFIKNFIHFPSMSFYYFESSRVFCVGQKKDRKMCLPPWPKTSHRKFPSDFFQELTKISISLILFTIISQITFLCTLNRITSKEMLYRISKQLTNITGLYGSSSLFIYIYLYIYMHIWTTF